MDAFTFITRLDGSLQANIALQTTPLPDTWLLLVNLFHAGDPVGRKSFTLRGFTRAEAEELARNAGSNDWIMREIDEYLWGESD